MLPLLDRMAAWALPVTLMSTAMPPVGMAATTCCMEAKRVCIVFWLGRAFPFPNAEPVFDGGDKALSQLRAQDAPGHAPHDTTGGSAERSEKAPQERSHLGAGRRTRPATGKAAGRVCRGIDLLSHGGIGIKENRRPLSQPQSKSRAPAPRFWPRQAAPRRPFCPCRPFFPPGAPGAAGAPPDWPSMASRVRLICLLTT